MRREQFKIRIRLSSFVIFYIAIILTMIKCDMAEARDELAMQKEPAITTSVQDGKVTEDLLANSIKAEWPSDKWKVVPKEEICVPPAPCATKPNEPTTATLHEKLKYECPPCRKCTKEIAQIKKLKADISEYLDEIERLKRQLADARAKPAQVQIQEKRVEVADEKKNFLYFSPMYSQDGIIATDKEGDAVYEAQPVQRLMIGGGYTRFFEWSKSMDIGLGIGGYIGDNNYGIDAQIGVKF